MLANACTFILQKLINPIFHSSISASVYEKISLTLVDGLVYAFKNLTPSDQGPHILFTRYVKNKTNLDITCKSCAWCIPDVRMQMIRRWGQEQKKWLTCCGGPRRHDDVHADRAQCVPDVHTWTFNHTFTLQCMCSHVNFPIKFMRSIMIDLFQTN